MNVQYLDIKNKVVEDRGEVRWVEKKLSRLGSDTEKSKRFDQRRSAPHSTSVLYNLRFDLLNHLVKDLERSGSLSCTDAATLEHFDVLARQSHRMTSRRPSTRMQKTVQKIKNAVCKVQRTIE